MEIDGASYVALRKESVDRNNAVQIVIVVVHASLSARRAWIEISRAANFQHRSHVALRKESVDRNMMCTSVCFVCVGSLSARRAWIEI